MVGQLAAAGVPLAGLWLQDWGGTRNTSIGRGELHTTAPRHPPRFKNIVCCV